MKGVIIEKTGGTEVLQYKTDLAVPEPKDGQVLVKNDYVGINYIDTYAQLPMLSIVVTSSQRAIGTSAPVCILHPVTRICLEERQRAP